MTPIAWSLAGLIILGTVLYLRIGLGRGTATIAVYLLFWSFFADADPAALGITWTLFAAAAAVLNIVPLRRRWISKPVFSRFRRALPPLSRTEREALEAGNVWWDGELFQGAPRWPHLLDTPVPVLNEAEQAFLDGPVESLCQQLDDWQINQQSRDLPPAIWQFLKNEGFFGLIIPQAYGGFGFSAVAHSAVVMKIASRSVTAAVTVMVPNSLGPAELLLQYGTPEQKQHYLSRLARGEAIPCFALTGPEAGSDASSLTDTGVVCRQTFRGKENCLGIRLNWDKRYITLGPVATVLGLAFRLYDPDHLLGEAENLGITLALIPTDLPGIDIGRRHRPMDIPFQNGPTRGRDVFIPVDWIIGGRARAGQGWRMLMEALAAGRGISLPALSTGAAKLASRVTGAYARVRRQFGLPIGRFEGIEEPLARIAGLTYQMDAARLLTAAAVAQGEKPAVLTAVAKHALTERMRTVINHAMDIHGGKAICLGPRNLLARAYQAVPIGITVEGANILTRSMIIFGQGAIRCHPYIRHELDAAGMDDPTAGSHAFDQAFFGHIGFILSNAVRSAVLGLTGARLARAPGTGIVHRYYQQLSRMSAAFALATDLCLLTLGGDLKRREKLSGRLADVLSNLYLASAVLYHHHHYGVPEQLPLLRWACEDSLYRMQTALSGLCRNLPVRPAAWLLRTLIFPLGQHLQPPDDRLGHSVATILLEPGQPREALTAGIYLPGDTHEPLAQLEEALTRAVATEPLEKRLREAIRNGVIEDGAALVDRALHAGIIDSDETLAIELAREACRRVIAVDDFAPDLHDAMQTAPSAERGAEHLREVGG